MPANVTEPVGATQPVVEDLLATKLAPPSVRTRYVPRQRLMDALTAGGELRLTLVDAPTGYGKTMLVAAWCAERTARGERMIAWLSLARTENDPALFTRYLLGALRRAGAEVGERAETMLQVPGANPIAWMRSLVNDLEAAQAPITLVLDDYHLVSDPACHALVQFLVDHAPSSLHLLVCAREDPPIALGSLRAAGQLAEIRAADLRFTDTEAEQLLVEREHLQLDPDTVARLTARTEGWAAGIYLAALWLHGRSGQAADAARFAGDNRHVVDYLGEVVLDQLGDELREFLLSTSIVDRLCTSLCGALTERSAVGVLEDVERSNLFLVPLDESRTWYRYHQLFREMLQSELARKQPDRVPELHRRASAWYQRAGFVSEAIEHATAAGDFDSAADLIAEHWLDTGRWGQAATIRTWLEAFDEERLHQYPELGLVGGLMTGVSGGSELEFRRWLELAEAGLARPGAEARPVAGTTSLRAGVNLLRSAFGYRDIGGALATAARTVRMESESRGEFRVPALAGLGSLLYLSGDLSAARHSLSEALRDPEAQRRPHGYISALATSALVALDQGDAVNAEHAAARALEYAAAAGLADNQMSGLAHAALGRALLVAGRPESARTHLDRAVELLHGGVMPAWYAYALLWAAPAAQATGDLPAALARVDEAEKLLASFEDAGTLTALLEDVQRRVTLARRRRREPDSAALTDTELAVLRLLRGPKSQRAIANELSISINTVKTHTSSIYRKLGVSSRDDAVTTSIERGLA